jgi:glycosyltransferase involved in cell wall biosynthesis
MKIKTLLIEGCNYIDYPIGGQLTFAKQMVKAFGNQIALVGISTDDTPVGVWVDKEFNGARYKFFAFAKRRKTSGRPLIPARLTVYHALRKYRDEILSLGIRNVFIQAPEVMLCVKAWPWKQVCYRFAGVENPLSMSRYPGEGLFSRVFESRLFSALRQVDVILATADRPSIEEMVRRSNGRLQMERMIQFPTRVNTSIFFPADKTTARENLHIPFNSTVIVTTGRINRRKGWELIVDAFKVFTAVSPDSYLFFVGDGEDRNKLQKKIDASALGNRVFITGYKSHDDVSKYLNAADLFVFGSYKEGWPTSLIEALACNKPIVTTDVSGAKAIVRDWVNGFVTDKREPGVFADAMRQALALEHIEKFSRAELSKYSLKNMASDMGLVWPPLKI